MAISRPDSNKKMTQMVSHSQRNNKMTWSAVMQSHSQWAKAGARPLKNLSATLLEE